MTPSTLMYLFNFFKLQLNIEKSDSFRNDSCETYKRLLDPFFRKKLNNKAVLPPEQTH